MDDPPETTSAVRTGPAAQAEAEAPRRDAQAQAEPTQQPSEASQQEQKQRELQAAPPSLPVQQHRDLNADLDAKRRRTSAEPMKASHAVLGENTQTSSPREAENVDGETCKKRKIEVDKVQELAKTEEPKKKDEEAREGDLRESKVGETENQVFDFCKVKSLEMGADIEVKWDVTDSEGNEVPTWFSAKLKHAAAETLKVDDDPHNPQDSLEIQVHIIVYPSVDEFPEDVRKVCFVNEHQLLDVETEEHQVWRRKGDTFDGNPQVMEEADAQAENDFRILDAAMQRVTVLGERLRACRDETEKGVLTGTLRELVTELMNGCLEGTFERLRVHRGLDLNAMPANRQNFMTDVVVRVKHAMVDRLVAHVQSGQAVDAVVVRDLLNEAVMTAVGGQPGAAAARAS
ncbi:Hypothetical Protein FCC1311_068202 [Hondaea fermentalgiana]|uniref:Uncharacterized protein n=1 Tax=Hondaea fermentalgiana TaxID=2315210 RepID=A0A2R5GI78_9STRA|nr:Hypothetical Protein FCC1311_068202 [Hondaea fermentalgiana]|eukprot:GBG30600.1 Hypothetical Protein FCC1311_068202 [Hondaea fermentalgiana]